MPGPQYDRLNIASVTSLTAPPYAIITHVERVSQHVLEATPGLLLIGPLGVNYRIEGADQDVVYLRRTDSPPRRGNGSVKNGDQVRAHPDFWT